MKNSDGKHTPEYSCWLQLRSRCSSKTNPRYQYYGGRGISVCKRWDSFSCFLSDMGIKPSAELSIDRIDNDGNYEPGNCRWATKLQQSRNTRMNINNTSGVCGVTRTKNRKKWQAQIKLKNKCIYLGSFKDLNEAKRARKFAEKELWQ